MQNKQRKVHIMRFSHLSFGSEKNFSTSKNAIFDSFSIAPQSRPQIDALHEKSMKIDDFLMPKSLAKSRNKIFVRQIFRPY